MTTYQNNFEGGTNGATIPSPTTTGGDAFTIGKGTGSTAVYDSTSGQLLDGSMSGLFSGASGANADFLHALTGTYGQSISKHRPLTPSTRTLNHTIVKHYFGSGSQASSVTLLAGSGSTCSVKVSSHNADLHTFTSVSIPFTVAVTTDPGTTTTDGKVKFMLYQGDGVTPTGGMTVPIEYTGLNTAVGGAINNVAIGYPSTEAEARSSEIDSVIVGDQYGILAYAVDAPPTVTAGSTVTMASGNSATITFSGSDTDGTVSSFACTLNSTSSTTTPTIGSPTYTGIGTASASASFPISNLTPGDHYFNGTDTDNASLTSTTAATTRIIYTSLAPTRRSVTLNGVTMTTPTSGTALAALNNQVAVPPVFVTAGPPASTATVTEVYQPLDSASVAPYFGHWWAASDTVTPITVYVDLKFNGTTVATQSATLTSTTPVFVGRYCTSGENATITDRSTPSIVSRFS